MFNLDEIRQKLSVPVGRIKGLLGDKFAVTLIASYLGKDKAEVDMVISTDGVTVAAETLRAMQPVEPSTTPAFDADHGKLPTVKIDKSTLRNDPKDKHRLDKYLFGFKRGTNALNLSEEEAKDPDCKRGYDNGYRATTEAYLKACKHYSATL